jgi:dihydropyrimidine dehydrogenase (NAD+) subunit PreT
MSEVRLSPEQLASAFEDLHPAFTSQEAVVEANRCLYCFDAPCMAACPTHIDVPRFIKKIASGNVRGSALAILDANILGLSCSRVCPVDVLCEGSCVLHRYNRQPIEIGRLQRHAMEHFYARGASLPLPVVATKTQTVACVGAGPASLACAAELRRSGYGVTLFEARDLAGGLNTHGVAEYKFRPSDSLREVDFIRSLGVEIRTGVTIGRDIALDDLERDYAAIFVGLGLGPTDKPGIPGEDSTGVIDAVTFIAAYKIGGSVPLGNRVVVIGGGNTAIDAAVAAKRLGAEDVSIVYRRAEADLPAFVFEYEHAKAEGVHFQWQTIPTAIHSGRIECLRTRLGAPDASGRARPEPDPDSSFNIPCDLVIIALGQTKLAKLLAGRGVEFANGSIVTNPATGQTANRKYFAGGDCANGGREVVDAVADGKRAARGIVAALESSNG